MRLRRIVRKSLGVIGCLLAFGLVKAPLEDRLTKRFTAEKLLSDTQVAYFSGLVGQSASLAVLGGMRPLVAIYATLHAFDAWSYRQWDTVERDYRHIVMLVPEDVDAWKTGAWHLSYNAAASTMMDESLPQGTRIRLSGEWIGKGVAFLEQGIEQHPRSSVLHKMLADIHREKRDDPCLAARHYKLAMEGDAPQSYVRRFYGYFLARCPGSEREAYQFLMGLYAEGKSQRLPTLIQRVKELEEKLAIPAAGRIPDPDPDLQIRQRYPNAQLP